MAKSTTSRKTGVEWRVAGWVVRHPGMVAVPGGLAASVIELGVTATGCVVVVVAAGVGAWYRGHPRSFDATAGRWLRAQRRRWSVYVGPRWRRVVRECDVTRIERGTHAVLVPRLVRVRCATASIDVLTVAMVAGQKPSVFEERCEELAHALGVRRVTVCRVGPGRIALIVERGDPFPETIPAPEIPEDSRDVDLTALGVGEDEYGQDFTIRLPGRCLLVAGTMGAGKGSLIWAPLRGIGPMIRDGLVRVWVIDLKGGMETARGRALFAEWASDVTGALRILRAFRDHMRARQALLKAARLRNFTLSVDTPFEWLVIDELAMLSAYADRVEVREAMSLLGEIQTQGRAIGFGVAAYVQEPTKDIVDTRDLFTERVCLAVTSASHVDMVLGEGARDRGALADQIPLDEDHAGIGFVVAQRSRRITRIRASYVTDEEIDELVATCAPHTRLTPVPVVVERPGREVA
ncbi:MAG: FtsK/SpoIIIE domain-containing protein [Pseudonocardiaceae bacterium]